MALLEVRRLRKSFGGFGGKGRVVVDDVSFDVDRGEIVGLLGPNGAGKTTTFRMTIGLMKPDAGRVMFQDKDITNLPMYHRARLGLGYLSQESSIFRRLTVEQNIMAVLEAMNLSTKERKQRCRQLLSRLELAHLAKNRAETLSGGERRRLEITRALVTKPGLILLDEPFSGVDPIAVFEIRNIILRLKRQGIGILLTDHSVREVLSITDRSYIINNGKVLCGGSPEKIIADPRARKVYLGNTFSEDARPGRGPGGSPKRDVEDPAREEATNQDSNVHIDDQNLLQEFRKELDEEEATSR